MSYSFKKNQRLLKKQCFQRVIARDKKKVGSYLRIYYHLSDGFSSKLGITASSYFGNAIERNLFKRRIREIFRKNHHTINKSIEIVIYPQKAAKKTSYSTLHNEFLFLLKNI